MAASDVSAHKSPYVTASTAYEDDFYRIVKYVSYGRKYILYTCNAEHTAIISADSSPTKSLGQPLACPNGMCD